MESSQAGPAKPNGQTQRTFEVEDEEDDDEEDVKADAAALSLLLSLLAASSAFLVAPSY